MTDLVERLRNKARRRERHGLTGWVLAEEALCSDAADEIERLRALLRRVQSCGLNEEPHGVGFTPSRQERKAGELARDIDAALGKESKDQRNGY